MTIEADVAVVGAGPAGASAAAALARGGVRTVVVERLAEPEDRIGETLPGAARRVLAGLGLLERFEADGHGRCYARRSVWGAAEPVELDGLHDPDGFGWRLDRRRFEQSLRSGAEEAGALLLAPARPEAAECEGAAWRLALEDGREIRAAILIDASGRSSRLLRGLGARREAQDRLVCAWTHLRIQGTAAGITFVESEPGGWWYSAPLADGRRVLAFHSDSDLMPGDVLEDGLVHRALELPALAAEIGDCDPASAAPARICAAHSARLVPAAGDGWFAAGDAATAFDPLSSQGLFNALYTGMAAGEAALRTLGGHSQAAAAYKERLADIWAAYERHKALFYGEERRWPESRFWARRLVSAALATREPMA